MITPTFFADTKEPQDALKRLAAAMGKDVRKIVNETAPSMARYAASYTQPVADADTKGGITLDSESFTGDSPIAKKLGQARVEKDIKTVYMSPAEAYAEIKARKNIQLAKSFYQLVKQAKLTEASKLFRDATGRKLDVIEFDGGALHQKARNKQGRVKRKYPLAIVSRMEPLKAYIKAVQKRVGWAKSGWIAAGRTVPGGKGGRAPAWMSQAAPGSSSIDEGPTQHYVNLVNGVKYAEDVLSDRYFGRAMRSWEEAMHKRADAILAYNAKKQNLT